MKFGIQEIYVDKEWSKKKYVFRVIPYIKGKRDGVEIYYRPDATISDRDWYEKGIFKRLKRHRGQLGLEEGRRWQELFQQLITFPGNRGSEPFAEFFISDNRLMVRWQPPLPKFLLSVFLPKLV